MQPCGTLKLVFTQKLSWSRAGREKRVLLSSVDRKNDVMQAPTHNQGGSLSTTMVTAIRRLPDRKQAVLITVGDKARHDESWAPTKLVIVGLQNDTVNCEKLVLHKRMKWWRLSLPAGHNRDTRIYSWGTGLMCPSGAATGYATLAVNSGWSIGSSTTVTRAVQHSKSRWFLILVSWKRKLFELREVWQRVSITETTQVATMRRKLLSFPVPEKPAVFRRVLYFRQMILQWEQSLWKQVLKLHQWKAANESVALKIGKKQIKNCYKGYSCLKDDNDLKLVYVMPMV